jgi:hypothetical protein
VTVENSNFVWKMLENALWGTEMIMKHICSTQQQHGRVETREKLKKSLIFQRKVKENVSYYTIIVGVIK